MRKLTNTQQTLAKRENNGLRAGPAAFRQTARAGVDSGKGRSNQRTEGTMSKTETPRYRGEVVYLFAYDVAHEMSRYPVRELLGQPVAQFSVDASKRSPRHLFFYRPQMVRLPILERHGPRGPVRMERIIKLLPIGAISITVRVPFEAEHVEELVEFHDLQLSNGALHDEVRQLAEQVRHELAPHYIRPVPQLAEEEAYTAFCLESPLRNADGAPVRTEDWLKAHRRTVAALLTQETDVARLSHQESIESTDRYLSYYENDLVVMDWDAALLVDERKHFDETLYILELANLQLAELEAYDLILDNALERAYRDVSSRPGRRQPGAMRELREIRIDLERFSDELSNITKFFGDWHLARIYENVAARFHLGDWHRTIDAKLKTLADLYQILDQDRTNRWMIVLELTIVLLFIIDLVILVLGAK
jgi:hypothetical protein